MLVLLDTTILTNFAMVGLASIPRDLWGNQVCATSEVIAEYIAGVNSAALPQEAWKDLNIINLSTEEQALAIKMFSKLGRGERSSLAVAIARAAMLATDDQLARRTAQLHGIEVFGTLGILKVSVAHGLLSKTKAQRKLQEMIAAGYYSPVLKLDFD